MPERRPWREWPNLISVCLLLLIGANYFRPFADLDFAWQIRTGELICQTGQLRPAEAFSYTIAGQPIPDFEWLYEILLYVVWSGFGFGGLKLLRVLLVFAPLLLLAWRLHVQGVRKYAIALSVLAAIAVVAQAWNLRPMYCTTIGLLLVSGWLHDHCTGRRPLSWWLPVVMLLWSNLHPGVITGQGLLAGAIAWEWLNRLVGLNRPLEKSACWRLTLVGGAGFAATFLSPDPIGRILYPFKPELAHPINRIFSEMQPLHSFLFEPPFASNLAYVLAGLVLLTLMFRFREYRLWEVALLTGLAGLANLAVRSLQDWMLIMLALGVPHLSPLLHGWLTRPNTPAWRILLRIDRSCKRTLNSPMFRFQWFWPTAFTAVLVAVSLMPPLSRRMPMQEHKEWPTAAFRWIEDNGIEGRFFGKPDYGSYVRWKLNDRGRSYVDTRAFFFPPELLEDSHFVPQLGPDWQQRLERVFAYQTEFFLLETTGPRGKLWQAIQPHVEPLYCDDQTVLLTAQQVRQGVERMHEAEDRVAQGSAVSTP